MALIKCPECNREISDKAESCPHCGYPLKLTEETRSEADIHKNSEENDNLKNTENDQHQEITNKDEKNDATENKDQIKPNSVNVIDEQSNNFKDEKIIVKNKRTIPKSVKIAGGVIVGLAVVGCIIYVATGDMRKYSKAEKLSSNQQYEEAMTIYNDLGDYEDSQANYESNAYQYCKQLMDELDYKTAIDVSSQILDYKDTKGLWTESVYEYANQLVKSKKYSDALDQYKQIPTYSDVPECIKSTEHLIDVQNDKTSPVIYGINENEVIEIDYNTAFNIKDYINEKVTLEDNVSSDVNLNIVADPKVLNDDGNVNTNTPGEFPFGITVTDEAGNKGKVSFVVKIDDTIYVTIDNPNPIVYEGEYGKVTLQKCTYKNNWGNPLYEFEFLVENKSNINLSIVFSDAYIDNYSVGTSGSAGSVEPGRQGVEDTSFWDKDIPEDKKNFTEVECIFSLRQGFYGATLYERRMIIPRDVIQ